MNCIEEWALEKKKDLDALDAMPKYSVRDKFRYEAHLKRFQVKWRIDNCAPYVPRQRTGYMGEGLREMIRKENLVGKSILEIGCFAGESAMIFLEFQCDIICVDPWNLGDSKKISDGHIDRTSFHCSIENAEKVFDHQTGGLVKKIKAFDKDIIKCIRDNSLDFVYIDAIHTYEEVKRQINDWLPKISTSGKIGGHDFTYGFPGVEQAVMERFNQVRTYKDTSWVANV